MSDCIQYFIVFFVSLQSIKSHANQAIYCILTYYIYMYKKIFFFPLLIRSTDDFNDDNYNIYKE